MKRQERDKSILLRKRGMSLGEIARRLKVSKAIVSVWVRSVPLSKKQRESLNDRGFSIGAIEKRREARIAHTQQRHRKVIDTAKTSIKEISKTDLKLIGTALYWGEGGKSLRGGARIANSDPRIIVIMMRFFREVFSVPETKFRGQVHTFSHLNAGKAERYWSKVSGIPTTQFYKTYSKPSIASQGKKDNLPNGTFDIYVSDTIIFLTIQGWIERLAELGAEVPHRALKME